MTGAGGRRVGRNPDGQRRSAQTRADARSMPPGTVVRLPKEHGGGVGYKHYSDAEASYVLVPGADAAEPERVGFPPETVLEVLATPCELAEGYVRRRAGHGRAEPDPRRRGATGRVVELRPAEASSPRTEDDP